MRISVFKLSLLIIIPFTILYGFSCKGKGSDITAVEDKDVKAKIKAAPAKLIRIDNPTENKRYSSGDQIELTLSLLGEEVPDSIRVYFDGKLCETLLESPWLSNIDSRGSRMGKVALKVLAYSGDRRPQTLTRFILIFSDIIPEIKSYKVINVYPHDPMAYTQGLLVHNGYFYESTGPDGRSSFRKVEIESGEVVIQHNLENKFFGEGLALINKRFYQLTWKHNTGFVYDAETFTEIRRIHYDTQGWGLTSDGEKLFMSDGSNTIYILEPEYFTVLSSIDVYDNQKAVYQLNELEYIDGVLWANIYTSNLIAKIDPLSGKVLTYYDLTGIIDNYDKNLDSEQVLNGIAWDKETEKLYVTGKEWSKMFEIELR